MLYHWFHSYLRKFLKRSRPGKAKSRTFDFNSVVLDLMRESRLDMIKD